MTSNPLAFLPIKAAEQFQISCYLYVTGLAIVAWDWCITIADEYEILHNSRLSLPIVVYFLSRIGTLGYGIAVNIFQFAAVGHCQALIYVTGGFLIVGNSSTTLLFLFRVRAVYEGSRITIGFFSLLWLANLGLCIMVPLSLKGEFIGPTKRCYSTPLRPAASVPVVINGVYDTLVFIFISFRITSYSIAGDSWRERTKSIFTADGLPRLSRNLLQGGQLYYFASALMTVGTCILVYTPTVPPFFRALLAVPSITFPSVMACRVFRDIRLNFIRDTHPSSFSGVMPISTEVDFASIPLANFASSNSQNSRSNIRKGVIVKDDLPLNIYAKHAPPVEIF